MSSLSPVGRSAAARKVDRFAVTPKNDRVSLCSFTFSDGRRCCTPRVAKHPRFCFYHAQKEARAHAAKKLGKDLTYFFSGDYLSACDLSTAMARLIPAVLRGDVKPKTAHTVAYLAQTLMQAIHISQHEYINAFGTDGWRKSVRNSVKDNYDYRFPPDPEPEQPPDQAPHAVAGLQTGGSQAPHPAPAQQSAPAPHTSLPPTGAEFVQHVVAGLQTGTGQRQPPQPATTPSPTPAPAPPPAVHASPSSPVCHAERSEASHPIPGTQSSQSPAPPAQPACPEQGRRDNPPQPRPATGPNRDAPWLNWGDQRHIRPDSHLL